MGEAALAWRYADQYDAFVKEAEEARKLGRVALWKLRLKWWWFHRKEERRVSRLLVAQLKKQRAEMRALARLMRSIRNG